MNLEKAGAPIHVAVRIREPLLHAGACAALQREPGIAVVDRDAQEPLDDVDVLVVDDSAVPDLARGGLGHAAGKSDPRLLVLAASGRQHAIHAAFMRGIHGIVLTSSTVEEFVSGIKNIAEGNTYLCQALARQMRDAPPAAMLTAREDDVLQLLAQGLCNKSIARMLDIAPGTVKFHVRSIMAKLNASTRTEVASIAISRGMTAQHGLSLPKRAA